MAKISVVCPKCQTKYQFDERHEGRRGRCRKCGQVFVATRQAGDASTASPKRPPADKPAAEREADDDGVPKVWQIGDVILDLYEITDVLGEGGMGTVFKAHHKGWNKELAVKSPKPEIFTTKGGMDNFVREAKTWIDLGLHPHTVSCFYVRTLGGIPRVFAEYVEGGSLKDWIEDGRLYEGGADRALVRILDIAIQFAWGLHYAHEKGLIHQDVKPANVMMTPNGMAKVTDFGLAKARATAGEIVAQDRQQSILVSSGGMTPAYCSPEQANGEPLSRKTDLWSWAVSVLEMFTGEVTWPSGSVAAEALDAYCETGTSDVGSPTLLPSFVELLHQCFRQEPGDRPQDMLAIVEDLRAVYHDVHGREYAREQPSVAEELPQSLNNRAVSLIDLGMTREAERAWEQALEADSHHLESTYNLGLIQWRTGRMLARELVRRLSEERTSRSGRWIDKYLLGRVLLEQADWKSAIAQLEGIKNAGTRQFEVTAALDLARHCLRSDGRGQQPLRGSSGSLSVCLSSDARHALSGNADEQLELWNVSDARRVRTFEGHSGRVTSVCLSSDGSAALSGSQDSTVKLWDVASGQCLRTFEGHSDALESVSLSGDCRYALSGGGWEVKLWETSSGRCLQTFKSSGPVSCVGLSSDGSYALVCSYHALALWEMPGGHRLHTFQGHFGTVQAACLSCDGRYVLSGSDDKTLKLWNVGDGRCVRTFEGDSGLVSAVSLSGDNGYALSSDHWTVKLWEVASGHCRRALGVAGGFIPSVALSGDGRQALFAAAYDLTLWKWGGPEEEEALRAPLELCMVQDTTQTLSETAKFQQFLLQADQAFAQLDFATCAANLRQARAQAGRADNPEVTRRWVELCRCLPKRNLAKAWEAASFEESFYNASKVRDYVACVKSVHLSRDGRRAVSAGDREVMFWELPSGKCLQESPSGFANSVCLSGDGRCLFLANRNCVTIRDLASGQVLQILEHSCEVSSLCLSSDSRYVLSGSGGTLNLWDVATARCLRSFEGHSSLVDSVSLSSGGRYALSGDAKGNLKLWDVATARCVRSIEGHSGRVASVCLSGDDRYGLSGSFDSTVKLWELTSGQCLRTFEGHSDKVGSVCLSSDGCFALSGSGDTTLKLWEIASGQCLWTFEGHAGPVNSVCLSNDGRYALSGGWKTPLKLWLLDWDLEDRDLADWDEGARPYLEVFLTQQTPYASELPHDRNPTEAELQLALTRRGEPHFTDEDFQRLFDTLGCAGYGWLRPEGVRRKLEEMAAEWKGPPPL